MGSFFMTEHSSARSFPPLPSPSGHSNETEGGQREAAGLWHRLSGYDETPHSAPSVNKGTTKVIIGKEERVLSCKGIVELSYAAELEA